MSDTRGVRCVLKRNKKMRKKQKRYKLRIMLKVLLLFFLLAVLGVLVMFYVKYGDDLFQWKSEAKKMVEESNKETFRSSETSTIYASDKKPIVKLRGDKDSQYLEFEYIPQEAIDCMVVMEDKNYYEHSGVSILSFGKAAALYIKAKVCGEKISRGGSTITQQVAKNVFLSNEKTEERKIREIFLALELDRKYTKDEIMEFYLNSICFANGHFGIEAASLAYFSKSVKELDLAEIAFLCAIPNRPTYYDPLDNFDATNTRKELILKQLLEEEKISEEQYNASICEEIVLKPEKAIENHDYMTTYAIFCATKALMQKQGFKFRTEFDSEEEREKYNDEYNTIYEECHNLLYTGGYQIYTSLSYKKQKKLQKSVNQVLSSYTEKNDKGIYKLQGAATCIDNKTGFVVAIVGGRRQKNMTGYTLNRAFQSFRQPGSSFKPLVVYTPQLERGYTADTIVDDTYFEGGPKNSDGTYAGKITLRRAVEQSKNVVAWKLMEELTPKVGLSYILKMDYSQIVNSDYYLAASLGGLTNGASTVEMAAGYSTLENDGVYRTPTCIKKITDLEGNILIDERKRKGKNIYNETAARMMTDILQGVFLRGTARGKGLTNMACAGKSGTTNDNKDGWFCGYTPYYTTAVWVGYDSPQTLNGLYGSTYPLTIWHNYMEEIHSKLARIEFNTYESPLQKKIYNTDRNEDVSTEETYIGDRTEKPVVTEKPTATKEPVVTEQPNITDEPVVSITPTMEPVQETSIEQDDQEDDSVSEDDSKKDSLKKEAD